jgi:hypothetical protein
MFTIVIAGLVFAVGVGGLLWYYSENEKIKRALREAKKYSIKEFPDGAQGKIVGRVEFLGEPLRAPLSGRPCAFYSIRVEEYRSNGKSGSWYKIIGDEVGINFGMSDGTGQAIIHAEAAKTVLTEDHETKSGTFDDPTEVERAYLESKSVEGQGWVFNKSLRYIEGVLEADEMVSVFGYGSKEPDPDAAPAGYRDMAPMRLRISGSANHPPLISDHPSVH